MADSAVTGSIAVATLAVLADISGVFHTYPVLSFVGMGMVGGLGGWALALDRGDLDHVPYRIILCMLGRRLILGACIGIAAATWWADDKTSQGLWVFLTGLLSIDPVRGVKAVWNRVFAKLTNGEITK